jgi:catechol 2,3-dioxygenase-like lactoylglutathione lyase family enzyme
MAATAINHVNLPVDDLEESVAFYEDVLGLERIPAINSSARGAWFRLGDAQLHLTERGSSAPEIHHLAVTVDDFPALYDELVERDALDETFGAPLYEFPDGAVQVYFRDPSGNLLEADWPDVATLPARIRGRVRTRAEVLDAPQTGEAREATLFPD